VAIVGSAHVPGICKTFEELEIHAPGEADFPDLMKQEAEEEIHARRQHAPVYSLSVAGFSSCPFHQETLQAATQLHAEGLVASLEDRTFATRDDYRAWLFSAAGRGSFQGEPGAQQQTTCPFVWTSDMAGARTFVGGCDATKALASKLREGAEQQQQQTLELAASATGEYIATGALALETEDPAVEQARWSRRWRAEWEEMHRVPRDELRQATYILGGYLVVSAVTPLVGYAILRRQLGVSGTGKTGIIWANRLKWLGRGYVALGVGATAYGASYLYHGYSCVQRLQAQVQREHREGVGI
jgi:hypothetical protein